MTNDFQHINQKPHTDRDSLETWLKHISALVDDIGPRGSTTNNERQAAEYCASVYARLGLAPQIESFTSAVSGYELHLLAAVFILLAFAIYPINRLTAAVAAGISTLVFYSEVMEMLFRNNPLRRIMRKGTSQNVIATLPPADEHQQDLILMGHLDSNRSALIFSTMAWTDFWRVVTPIIFFSFGVQAVLYIIGAVTGWQWAWQVSFISAGCALLLAAITLEGELSAYSPGANDNASGAGLVLAMAERLSSTPLAHTRVWFVNTGCEEVKHYGAINFFERHLEELHNPRVLVFEMLGRDGPAWLEYEVIVPLFGYHADQDMIALLERLVAENEALTGHPTRVTGGHTEQADPLRLGIPAVALIGIGPEGTGFGYDGPPLYWHHPDDTTANLDRDAMARNYALAWAFISALDEQASSS